MITKSGVICDVCDKYILFDKSINPFSAKGIKETLHCHDGCKKIVSKTSEENNYKLLPEGRLRRCFEEAEKSRKTKIKD